jgi:hypothetical protein
MIAITEMIAFLGVLRTLCCLELPYSVFLSNLLDEYVDSSVAFDTRNNLCLELYLD